MVVAADWVVSVTVLTGSGVPAGMTRWRRRATARTPFVAVLAGDAEDEDGAPAAGEDACDPDDAGVAARCFAVAWRFAAVRCAAAGGAARLAPMTRRGGAGGAGGGSGGCGRVAAGAAGGAGGGGAPARA